MRKVLTIAAALACAGLVSCSETRAPGQSAALDTAPISRAPLQPAPGYAPAPEQSYNDPLPQSLLPAGEWRASPRWSAVQGNGCIAVDQDPSTGKLAYENCPPGQQAGDQPQQHDYQ